MIVIHVQVKVKPDQRSEFVTQATRESDIARNYPGCARYNWSVDLRDQQVFALYEEWDTQASFDAYKVSDDFKQMGSNLMPLLAEEPQSSYYTAAPLAS